MKKNLKSKLVLHLHLYFQCVGCILSAWLYNHGLNHLTQCSLFILYPLSLYSLACSELMSRKNPLLTPPILSLTVLSCQGFSQCVGPVNAPRQLSWRKVHGRDGVTSTLKIIEGEKKISVNTRSHSENTDSPFVLTSFLGVCVRECACNTRCRPDYWPVSGDTFSWHPHSVCLCLTPFISPPLPLWMHHMTSLPGELAGMPVSTSIFFYILYCTALGLRESRSGAKKKRGMFVHRMQIKILSVNGFH